MTASRRKLRLSYRVDTEPVNGWVLSRCEALDLISQGRTAEQARTLLQEEARLYLGQAKELGNLPALLERLAAQPAGDGAPTFDLDLTKL
jgi:predicted RNase H-like HicB family nuclease